jgi:hypothetical protein
MQRSDWDRIAAPFPIENLAWRIQELAADGRSARVVPLLPVAAIAGRLDEVVGRSGWSLRYSAFDHGVGCELVVEGVARSAIVQPAREGEGPEECSRAALAGAAFLFGMEPPVEAGDGCWVDYDSEEGVALFPEDLVPEDAPATAEATTVRTPDPGQEPGRGETAERTEQVKPEGQQAIDRLVERLKAEGSGLEAARLLVRYGGYGSDPQAARELYGKLRDLLARRAETST